MKKFKNVILHSLNLVIGALILAFMSLPHIAVAMLGKEVGTVSGFDLINFEGEGLSIFIAISLLMMAIFASILILISLIGILADFGVIKGKNIEKNIRNVSLITTTLMSIFALFAISSIGYQAANLTKINVGNEVLDLGEFAKATLGWACIVNFIMSLVTIILTVFTSKKFSKKKR